jgi:hypothetical protein
LLLWLDASDTASLELEEGEVVSWSDKSGNNNDARAYKADKRPVKKTQGVRFVDDMMEIRGIDVRPSTHDALTSIVVLIWNGKDRTLWASRNLSQGIARRDHVAETPKDELKISTQELVSSTSIRRRWVDGVLTNESTRAYKEGKKDIALGERNYARQGFNGTNSANYELMELILYSRALTDEEHQRAIANLKAKWFPSDL